MNCQTTHLAEEWIAMAEEWGAWMGGLSTAEVCGSYSYSCSCSCSYFTPAPQFENLEFELTKKRLVGIGYPAEISSFKKLPSGWVGHLDHDDGAD